MVDYVQISLRAGNGGRGAVSFEVRKSVPVGRPDGGDGGRGGNIYLLASTSVNTLSAFRFVKNFKSGNGENGGKSNRKGKDGADLVLKVPVGTVVKTVPSEKVVVDLDKDGERFLLLSGGTEGRGNAHLKPTEKEKIETGHHWRIWRRFEEGGKGEDSEVILELKVLADVGIIGLPNAGKSTLIARLTNSHPKIANYPFTTLEPNLGVMEDGLVLADTPGLIEGAHEGRGLGVQFLRHIERTKLLIHLIGADQEDPFKTYQVVDKELATFSDKLLKLPQIVILNKIDILSKEKLQEIKEIFTKKKVKILPISAVSGEGLEELKREISQYWSNLTNKSN